MSDVYRRQVFDNLNLKETDELVEIWTTNDRVEWSDIAFDVIQEILKQRLAELPHQNEPIFERVQPLTEAQKEELILDKYNNPNYEPVFYKPKQILWLNTWLKRVAIIAVVSSVFFSLPSIDSMRRIILSFFGNRPDGDLIAWIIALIFGGALLAFDGFVYFFSLRALESILKILMEMEFDSRITK